MEPFQSTGKRRQLQRQDISKQSNKFLAGNRLKIDHDSSIQTVGTLDDSRLSHAENYRADFRLQRHNLENEPQQNVLEQAYSSSFEREQEIVRLQKKMCKLQHRIGKLQKRVEHLQSL